MFDKVREIAKGAHWNFISFSCSLVLAVRASLSGNDDLRIGLSSKSSCFEERLSPEDALACAG